MTKTKYSIILWIFIGIYILYFSVFTVLRHQKLASSYFDLGIMHQTVYNTYQSLKTGDFGRFLEHTNPHGGGDLVKRMAIHNDVILAFLAPFYFIYDGPETLLVIQSIVLALGAYAIFQISQHVFQRNKSVNFLSLVFASAYLLYFPMQRANIFDFHAVTFSTTFLLFMFYFWLIKKYWASMIFLILSLLTKEQVGLTTAAFGIFTLFSDFQSKKNRYYSFTAICVSIVWVALSMFIIIPALGAGHHFAEDYYSYLHDDPFKFTFYLFHKDSWEYLLYMLGPLGFLSLLSPAHFFITLPEFGINLLSTNWNMRNIIYHYTAVLQPFLFVSAIYGAYFITKIKPLWSRSVAMTVLFASLIFSFLKSPLPYSREADIYSFQKGSSILSDFNSWKKNLRNADLKISATGHLGAHLTSRRYFYNFSDDYVYADYIVLDVNEATKGFQSYLMKPAYQKLQKDSQFEQIFKNGNLEVYKKR